MTTPTMKTYRSTVTVEAVQFDGTIECATRLVNMLCFGDKHRRLVIENHESGAFDLVCCSSFEREIVHAGYWVYRYRGQRDLYVLDHGEFWLQFSEYQDPAPPPPPSAFVPKWYRRKDGPECHVEAMKFDGTRESADRIVTWLQSLNTGLAKISHIKDPPHWQLSLLNPDTGVYRVPPDTIVAFNDAFWSRAMMFNPFEFMHKYELIEPEPTNPQ